MRNIRKVRTQDREITLTLLDDTTIKWSAVTANLIYHELLELSRHEHVLKEAENSQNEPFIRDAQKFITVEKSNQRGKGINYRFNKVRLRYDKMAGRCVYRVVLPPGLPLTLREIGELRETLREHTKFNGPGALTTPRELEPAEDEPIVEAEEDENDCGDDDGECLDFTPKEGALTTSCEDCIHFPDCFPEEVKTTSGSRTPRWESDSP